MYKEHKAGEETIWLTDEPTYSKPGKPPGRPFEVGCLTADGEEIRWVVYFATLEEAEKEYIRFD